MGKFLPAELAAEMKIKVEAEEAESMSKAIENLKKVDSVDAANMINRWITNANTPEYKKEAGMMFMMENY
jgi:hypothetical protein